ncbi:MAG: helical backbone metal receptor [Bacteroidota bacterium]
MLDHLGRVCPLSQEPQRIISLVPSITETLFALGLKKHVVGRTRFCIHPQPAVQQVVRVGGTKQINYARLQDLKPDLIVAEKEENTPEMIAELEKSWPVFVAQVESIPQAHRLITDLGKLCNRRAAASKLLANIRQKWSQVPQFTHPRSVAYYIWRDPDMVVGKGTYIQSVLERIGLENVFLSKAGRYPTLAQGDLARAKPDLVLLSSEPYPFKDKHIQEFQSQAMNARVELVDGEMFSWYGSRMEQAATYLSRLIRSWV